MVDFMIISTKVNCKGVTEIFPNFIIKKSSDLMIRGGDFYAVWVDDKKIWSTDEDDVIRIVDRELDKYVEKNRNMFGSAIKVSYMWDSSSGVIDAWHKYCKQQLRDSFHILDEELIFANREVDKTDYASKRLPYPLEAGDYSAWDKLVGTLYRPEERHKIEWAIGSIVSGDSRELQKFMVLYGSGGTGKSTILNIIQKLFVGYYSVFDAKALGSSSNSFALEAFASNPLVAIQHDGDLSRIEDNTRLNSLVSHELMTVNEKFKSTYSNRFKCFLFMGTNKPVKITDAKSGLIRRLIDVSPSGQKFQYSEYNKLLKNIDFQLGAIAKHCLDVYQEDPEYYNNYIPTSMFGASNDFYNFVLDSFIIFKNENCTTLKNAWKMYNEYCEEARVAFPYSQRAFKEELKNYFDNYSERYTLPDGNRVRSYYSGFKSDKFEYSCNDAPIEVVKETWLLFKNDISSVFDSTFANAKAQYATSSETPYKKWDDVTTTLSDINTTELHYVMPPSSHIVIDFDIKDENGNKNIELNLAEAKKWPPTYAEVSKSGQGIHLHYEYVGDVTKLSSVYDDKIEIKTFTGKSSLRRKLTKCNDLPIAKISSGLPLKGEKMINFDSIRNEKAIRTLIKKNLNKEIHPATKPSVDFIYTILEDAYNGDVVYDISDMENAIFAFAAGSTNQADYCLKLVNKMHFKSENSSDSYDISKQDIVFYDVEVFPNLFLVNWKKQGSDTVVRMINPTPIEIGELAKFNLVGFNCRRYDNHIMYARILGYTNEQLYLLSQRLINKDKDAFFGPAYNLSYTDIYDFASAGNKKSLKKLEIEMGIHHQELGLPWDKPVPESEWVKVAEYCDNDVIATEAAFEYLSADWTARQILADIAGMTVNDTTNSLTTKIIFGSDKEPQSLFNYRDMGSECDDDIVPNGFDEYTKFTPDGKPIFPGYEYKWGKSTYRGEDVGIGGYVYAEPGVYTNVALLDIASMHPHSILAEDLFGPYTERFRDLVNARIAIKHKDWDNAKTMLDGKLSHYVDRVIDGEMTSKQLANALKTAINSVYGLTFTSFSNPFKDPRNIDNIVAKRGALFMVNLKHEVQNRGYRVAHIKTDSIKIPDATPEIIKFVMDYGKMYGYSFEHEATYDRMCLVNDAVYIARYKKAEHCSELYSYVPDECESHGDQWTATGAQFAVPYTFKTLFSKEPIEFEDLCETKSVTSSLYLDMNENLPDVTNIEKLYSKKRDAWTKKDIQLDIDLGCPDEAQIYEMINKGHKYVFIGRVGQFCPIKSGCGGGELVREATDANGNLKYSSATGAKGYRWLESEYVKTMKKEQDIDKTYYQNLVDDALDKIRQYGDAEWFVSPESELYYGISHIDVDTPPWDDTPPFDNSNIIVI